MRRISKAHERLATKRIVEAALRVVRHNPHLRQLLASEMQRVGTAYEVGDLVKPSESYYRVLGPTTKKKDGLVVGKEDSFILVLWNDHDEPVPVHPRSLAMKKKRWKPNSPDIRRDDFREFIYSDEAGGQVRRA